MKRKNRTFWDFANEHPLSAYCVVFLVTKCIVDVVRELKGRNDDEDDDDIPYPD